MLEVTVPRSFAMPASVYSEMNNGSGLEDQRALQLAFELSLLGLGSEEENGQNGNVSPPIFDSDAARAKRSANMTECVPVPSSEHVAEIVGRQGCKIKALRAKTNTYIKTPVRGEEPVFVVTGRKEDVAAAKREILSAAEHFSQIRASRRNSSVSSVPSNVSGLTPSPPSPNAPGQVTIQVRVPYRVVGLVVGPKGATIKRIQQQTHTYIVTPSRDKEPVFEVTGLPENVEKARQEIESHIALRTGGIIDGLQDDDFHSNGIDSGFHELNGSAGDIFSALYNKSPSGTSAFTAYNNAQNGNNLISRRNQENNIFNFPPVNGLNGSTKMSDFGSMNGSLNGFTSFNSFNLYDNDEGIGSSPSFDPVVTPSPSLWPDLSDGRNSALVTLFGTTSTTTTINSLMSRRTTSVSGSRTPTISPVGDSNTSPSSVSTTTSNGSVNGTQSPSVDHQIVRRIRSDPLVSAFTPFVSMPNDPFSVTTCTTTTTNGITSGSGANSVTASASCSTSPVTGVGDCASGSSRKQCIMCSESEVVAALVPCGHNFFCMECASLIVEKPASDRVCPVCQQSPTQAIRIIS